MRARALLTEVRAKDVLGSSRRRSVDGIMLPQQLGERREGDEDTESNTSAALLLWGAGSVRAAIGAMALGALAVGATAAGAVAIGALAIRALAVKRGKIERLNIEELEVGRLRVRELIVEQEQRAGAAT
jgi:hypothetical protein